MSAAQDWRLGLRAHVRHKIFQPALVQRGGAASRVHLLDVSRGGAQLHCHTPLEPGADVTLECADRQRPARIVWREGSRHGLQFKVPLDETQVAALIAP